MKKSIIAILSVLLLSCSAEEKQLNAYLASMFPQDEPGCEVLILKGDKVVFDHAYGIADIITREPITNKTSFNIASCSKQFTAVAILQLVEQGKVSLTDPVLKYFPQLPDSVYHDVEVWHLLAHSSGIPDQRGYLTREQRVYGDERLATEYLPQVKHLHFQPGTEYEYMNPTYVMLGQIVEQVSGQPFVEYQRDHIFSPADMTATCYFSPSAVIPNMAHGYEYGDLGGMSEEHGTDRADAAKDWYEYDYGEETFFATRPDGGIYTSALELVKWEKALRKALSDDPKAIVSESLLRDAMTPHTTVTGSAFSDYQNREDTYYGYGWFIEIDKHVIYHTGDNGGFKAYIGRYEDTNAMVVVLANRTDFDRYALKTRIEEIYHLR